jgi:hypothetical protein
LQRHAVVSKSDDFLRVIHLHPGMAQLPARGRTFCFFVEKI